MQWDDIAPFFRDFSATFNGKIYTIPLDGDFHMAYYRKDLLEKDGITAPRPGRTRSAVARPLQGPGPQRGRYGRYGSCLAKKAAAQTYWHGFGRGGFIQSQGTNQGTFFDPANMEPLLNNPAVAAALDTYKKLAKIGPPDESTTTWASSRGLFTTGRCALTLDWGDIGTLAIDKTHSKVADKVGAVILPGSTRCSTADRQARGLRRDPLPRRRRR